MLLLKRLEEVDYSGPGWRAEVAELLASHRPTLDDVRAALRAWTPAQARRNLDQCHETSTHYKWLLHRGNRASFVVWWHSYKSAELRGSQGTQLPHDHRYAFSSIMLAGSFISTVYEPPAPGKAMRPVDNVKVLAGETLSLGHEEIHALYGIAQDTHTLVVQGPILRPFSRVYDPDTGGHREFRDFDDMYRELTS